MRGVRDRDQERREVRHDALLGRNHLLCLRRRKARQEVRVLRPDDDARSCGSCRATVVDDEEGADRAFREVHSFYTDVIGVNVSEALKRKPRIVLPPVCPPRAHQHPHFGNLGRAVRGEGGRAPWVEVRRGLSFLAFCGTLAHEVMHLLRYADPAKGEDDVDVEGECELMRALYLAHKAATAGPDPPGALLRKEVRAQLHCMLRNPLPEYAGARKALERELRLACPRVPALKSILDGLLPLLDD
jgi:hypothetical protein